MSFFKSVEVEELESEIRSLKNKILDMQADHERALRRISFATDLEKTNESREKAAMVAERDAEILRLENKLSRLESELDARLKLQEDIHTDELIAVEDKYKAKLEAYEITNAAEREKVIAKAERDASQVREAAHAEAKSILAEAYRQADVFKAYAQTLLTDLLKKSEVPYDKIQSLVLAATENYPTLSDLSVSSISSST
jgi:hypothetical protein